jgi:hypothetical protein
MKIVKTVTFTGCLLLGGVAFGQQSEFKQKLQEDMDGYKDRIVTNCKATDKLKMVWEGGSFGVNPRESEKPDWNAVSTLCTSGLDALNACQENEPVRKAIGKVTTISCTTGKGTLSYKLAGTKLTFSVDPSFTKNNASGQESDLVTKMKKDIDK